MSVTDQTSSRRWARADAATNCTPWAVTHGERTSPAMSVFLGSFERSKTPEAVTRVGLSNPSGRWTVCDVTRMSRSRWSGSTVESASKARVFWSKSMERPPRASPSGRRTCSGAMATALQWPVPEARTSAEAEVSGTPL